MSSSRTMLDPQGYYARLGVDPWSGPAAITAAYRRKARLLHPDVPGTGDAAAFVELKQAYDVLIQPDRRAAYDRSAQRDATVGREEAREAGEIRAAPAPEMHVPRTRHPRLTDLPVAVWVGMAAVVVVGAIEIGRHMVFPSAQQSREPIPAIARDVPRAAPNEATGSPYGPAPVRLAGTPNFYVVPPSSPAVLWRRDEARDTFAPWGQLPPFSAVQGLRLMKSSGMVEVKVTDNTNGFVEASRLAPGDTAAAARAWCTYNAGPTPANGEVLSRRGQGEARLAVSNRTGQPAVVKLRSPDGALIASLFLGPNGEATLSGLPGETASVDIATGEAWSRACHGFAAGMRAQRLTELVALGPGAGLVIPPGRSVRTVDLSDQAFEQE